MLGDNQVVEFHDLKDLLYQIKYFIFKKITEK